MRGSGAFVFAQVKNGAGVEEIIDHMIHAWQHATQIEHLH
jgi:urease accessory protein